MRCNACDKALTEAEIQFIPQSKTFEMCSICLEVAMDAAYSDGFQRPDDADGVSILTTDIDDILKDGYDVKPWYEAAGYSLHEGYAE